MYTTIWKQKVKKRKGVNKGKTVIEDYTYQTKSLTDAHKRICDKYPDAETYQDGKLMYFCMGMLPFVLGGTLVNH